MGYGVYVNVGGRGKNYCKSNRQLCALKKWTAHGSTRKGGQDAVARLIRSAHAPVREEAGGPRGEPPAIARQERRVEGVAGRGCPGVAAVPVKCLLDGFGQRRPRRHRQPAPRHDCYCPWATDTPLRAGRKNGCDKVDCATRTAPSFFLSFPPFVYSRKG